jgi:4-hydroxythreonine-4-phosphate dehydrogenase
MNYTKPTIAITIGDAAGIGPEIVLKTLKEETIYNHCNPIVIGDRNVLDFYSKRYDIPVNVQAINRIRDAQFSVNNVNVIDTKNVNLTKLRPGENDAENGKAVLDDTTKAINFAQQGQISGVLAGPHTKKSIEMAGFEFDGYPSFVAKKTNTKTEETFLMLVSKQLRIVNVTLHVSLSKAVTMIDKELVLSAIKATHNALEKIGITSPRIAIAGLNPHAGEEGMFGDEEIQQISPAILEAKEKGMQVHGPFGSDSLFQKYKSNEYDAYVAMYHDQAHIPIKLLSNEVSAFTIGTPILFCTVGHGSAPDIAGKGIAKPDSLIETIRLVAPLS